MNAAIDDTAATEPPAQASPPLAGSAPSTSRPLHPSIQPALTAPVFQAFVTDDADQPPAATATERSVAPSPQVLSAATAPVAPPPPVSAVSVDGATLYAPIPPKPPPSAAPVASAPQLDLGLLLSRGNAMLALGDISAARLLYERATALGSAGAATRLGNTYDAAFLASIQARGIVADQAAAIAWYRKAAALGDTEAVHQLKRFAPAQ